MKLHSHPDFDQAIIQATEHFKKSGIREALIEKDYYVTEVLRTIANDLGNSAIFKGGTSLSKGWNLIQRFSEDIDMFISLPSMGTKAIDTSFKRIRDAITLNNPLRFLREESNTIGGLGRNDRFKYDQHFTGIGEVVGSILLETGIASGHEPTETVKLNSRSGNF